MHNCEFPESAKLVAIAKSKNACSPEVHCAICGKSIPSADQYHFVPIVPFAQGGEPTEDNCQVICESCSLERSERPPDDELTKEEFDQAIADFIERNHTINHIDFVRIDSPLPSMTYVNKYYGDFKTMKRAFKSMDLPSTWDRDTIREALERYVAEHGNFSNLDLKLANRLPCLSAILRAFPEYKTLSELKSGLGLVKDADAYANAYVSEADITRAVENYFGDNERTVGSMKEFFETFPYSSATIRKRFGSRAAFIEKYNITVGRTRKIYSKQDVDDAVQKWVQEGKGIPRYVDLGKGVLPSGCAIMKFYEHWKDPFIQYQKMLDEGKA